MLLSRLRRHLRLRELPPVEVEQRIAATSREAEEKVLGTRCSTDRARNRRPCLPSTRSRNIASTHNRTTRAAQAHLNLTTIARRADTRTQRLGTSSKSHALDLDVVVVVDIRNRHATLTARLRLQARRKCNSLRLLLSVRIQRPNHRRSARRHRDSRNRAVRVVSELLYRHRARIPAPTGQRTIMVEKVRSTVEINDSRMVREALARCRHNQATIRPRPRDARPS
jgi:hypothetical protein